ncbi:MAG TPA: cobalamin-dependent protein [Turneriella sp.]|nr:cobalamin-dependent protein [Turneriella sp.]HNL54656.1 cobalamin-dependent protein [Turneriella sp.]
MEKVRDYYADYLQHLINGDRSACEQIIRACLGQNLPYAEIYSDLIQHSLYEVGELWANDKITVAQEHLASSITEFLLVIIHQRLFQKRPSPRKAIIACTQNEMHQIGANRLEIRGWDSSFLGSNTSSDGVLATIDKIKPQLVGLSVTLTRNLPKVAEVAQQIRQQFPAVRLLIGGQAAYTREAQNFAAIHEYVHPIGAIERELV